MRPIVGKTTVLSLAKPNLTTTDALYLIENVLPETCFGDQEKAERNIE